MAKFFIEVGVKNIVIAKIKNLFLSLIRKIAFYQYDLDEKMFVFDGKNNKLTRQIIKFSFSMGISTMSATISNFLSVLHSHFSNISHRVYNPLM